MKKYAKLFGLTLLILAFSLAFSHADSQKSEETVSAPYLMAFHACDSAGGADCHNPQNHMVYLAGSDDGENWSLIPGWEPYSSSVPDVIRRGDTLYIYTPGQLVRYNLNTDTQEAPVQVDIPGLSGGFVDPSLIVDEDGRLVMFFLYGQMGMDPAGCSASETSCVREIGSATEVQGSDGSEFTLDEGQRASATIDPSSQIKSFSDPDIFFDGGQYVLYISHGPSTSVWVSKDLHGEYVQEPSLPQGMLTTNTGGVPAGYFDPANGEYWTYAHVDLQGQTIIRRAIHPDLYKPLNEADFDTVITGESIGLGASFIVASPGFAVNMPGDTIPSLGAGTGPGIRTTPEVDPDMAALIKESPDPLDAEIYLEQVNAQSTPGSSWVYQDSVFSTMPAGEEYDMGAFCRIFQRPDETGFDYFYGGSFREADGQTMRYNGDVVRLMNPDGSFATDPELISTHGGDFAIDSDGEFYYLLNGAPEGWRLRKYDLDFNVVGETTITLPEQHFANDQMVRVYNGLVFASGLYDPNFDESQRSDKQPAHPDQEQYTHLWIYDSDLNYVEDLILDDYPNINGGTLVYYEGAYAYVSADNFFSNQMSALLYDEDWNYLETVPLQDDAQWSMGGVYADGLIYIAYHKGEHGRGDVYVDVYDTAWELQETIEVTRANTEYFNAQRPWVQVYGDMMIVSYDVGRDNQDFLDLQCITTVYVRGDSPAPMTSGADSAPGEHPVPEFNPFEQMTEDQAACLRAAWGEEAFEEISNFKRPPTFDEEPALQECLGDAFMPPGEGGDTPGGHDPFVDQTYYATSSDGLNWSAGTLLADKASVPDVMTASDGALWAYWVDFTYMTGPNMERIGIARSDDNGESWEMLGNVNFTGLGNIVPVDPDVVELSDGRFRMYFYDIAVRELAHPIYSAISEDGINFTLEEGTRVIIDEIYDPDVVQLPDGGYRMYLNSGDILSAHSADGLDFVPDDGVRVLNGSVPGSILMPDGTIRMYNCAQGISVYESQDGLNFTLLKQGVIRDQGGQGQILCDPSVTAIPGGYLIVYKVNPGGGQ